MTPARPSTDTAREEWANVITHGLGLLLAIAAAAIGVVAAVRTGSPLRIVTVAVFVAALCFVYLTSTGFHLAGLAEPDARTARRRDVWLALDHSAIYLLIAGTYTPIVLLMLPAAWGWTIFGIVWACALAGLLRKLLRHRRRPGNAVDTALYLAMGWTALIAVVPIWQTFTAPALALLVAGGLFYSLGTPFFLWDRLPYNHAIWHLFVLAGSASHVVLVLWHAVPL